MSVWHKIEWISGALTKAAGQEEMALTLGGWVDTV